MISEIYGLGILVLLEGIVVEGVILKVVIEFFYVMLVVNLEGFFEVMI